MFPSNIFLKKSYFRLTMLIAGIDDAGRGPVIGPMVIAIAAMEEAKLKELKKLGVKDSKLLSPKRRETLSKKIKQIAKTEFVLVHPKEIDRYLSTPGTNINMLEAEKMAFLISKIKPDKAIIDCPSTNTKKFKELIERLINNKCTIIAEHKADLRFPIVSAASIIAKVVRDGEIDKIKKEIGYDFGSGYSSDPRTVKFLKEYWRTHHNIFRKEWISYKMVKEKASQLTLSRFFEEND